MNHYYKPVEVPLAEGRHFDLVTRESVEDAIHLGAVQTAILKIQ